MAGSERADPRLVTTGAERRPDRDAAHVSPAGRGRAAAHRSPEDGR